MELRTEIRATLRLALPIAFAQLAMMMMGLVDAAMVGRVSDVDLSAVSLGNSLAFSMVCPAMGVTMAVEPLASQAIGAGDEARAWIALRAGIVATLILVVPTIVVAAGSSLLLEPLGVDPRVIGPASGFVLARLPGMPGWLIFMAAKAYLEAKGLTRPLLLGGWAANIFNFVVCGLLVFGDRALERVGIPAIGLPAMGAVGAGLTTSAASTLLAAIALGSAWKARPAGASLLRGPGSSGGTDLAELKATTRKLLRVGVPIGFQILTEVGVFALVSLLIGRMGASTSAANQVALGLASFTYMGVLGMSAATAVRVGRAIGARDEGGPRRAGLVGIGLAIVYMVFCAALFLVFPRQLAQIFTDDPAVIEPAVTMLRVAAVFQIADGIQGVAGGALRGAADTRFASWANVACHWGVGLPLAVLFGFVLGHGAPGMWWGLSAGLFVVAVVLSVRFWRISSRAIAAV
jgi:multidrug resistance protein, MATE family